jgi:hypothetical protein
VPAAPACLQEELAAELCLLAPARLEHLIPPMPRMMHAVLRALREGGATLVNAVPDLPQASRLAGVVLAGAEARPALLQSLPIPRISSCVA